MIKLVEQFGMLFNAMTRGKKKVGLSAATTAYLLAQGIYSWAAVVCSVYVVSEAFLDSKRK